MSETTPEIQTKDSVESCMEVCEDRPDINPGDEPSIASVRIRQRWASRVSSAADEKVALAEASEPPEALLGRAERSHGVRVRRYAAWGIGMLMLALAAAAFVDRQTHSVLIRLSQTSTVLVLREIVTPFGQADTIAAVAAVVWSVAFLRRDERLRTAVFYAAVSVAASGLLVTVLKWSVARSRPYVPPERAGDILSGYAHSFPSADTALSVAFALALGEWFPRAKWPLMAAACLIGIMRTLRLAHWPSDVLAGVGVALLGMAAVHAFMGRRAEASAQKGAGRQSLQMP